MACHYASQLTPWRAPGFVLHRIELVKIDVEGEDLDDRHDKVLIDELLGELDLDVKLRHLLVVFHVEVLREEEWAV